MAKRTEIVTVVMRSNQDVDANALRTDAVSILMRFAAQVMKDTEYYEDDAVCMLITPDVPGDPEWMDRHVFKYADLLGTSTPGERVRRTNRLIELYDEAGGREAGAMGTASIRRTLDGFGLLALSASMIRRG